MCDLFSSISRRHLAIFAGGILFGTAGIKILSSKDAKKPTPMSLPPYYA